MKCAAISVRLVVGVLLALMLPTDKSHSQAPEPSQSKEIQIAADAFTVGEPVPSWVDQLPLPEMGDSQPVIVRLADRQYLVDQTHTVHVRSAIMVNDPAWLSSAGLLSIPFVPQYHTLKLHSVRIIRGGESFDRTRSSRIRFLQRETGLEQGIYSGEITASVLVDDVRVGDTIEYSYTRNGQNPVFGDKFVDAAGWDQGHPTLLRRIVLNYPANRRIQWRLIGPRGTKPLPSTQSTQDGMSKLVFEERSIPKVDFEPLAPPDYDVYRWLQFSEFPQWDDVARWARGLFQVEDHLSDELRDIVERLRKKPTKEERAIGALEFVQSEIRYFSVSLGESSHRPARPDVVLKQRYGDCKDKSLLLLTLLRALGIEARPVLFDAGRRRRLDEVLPSPQIFDHAIVQVTVDGRVFYLDPTRLGQHGKLTQMGQAHENAHVLVVSSSSGQLSTIASANIQELARNEWLETASLPKFGENARLRVRQIWRGLSAEMMRLYHERMPRDQLIKLMGTALEPRYPGATMVGVPDVQDDRDNNVVSVTASYDVPKLATEHGGNWVVRFLPSNMKGALATPPSSTRVAPLFLPAFPLRAKYVFDATLPEEVRVITDPRTDTVDNKHFRYAFTSAFRGNAFKGSIDLSILAERVDAAELQKYGEDLRAVSNIPAGVIVISKNAIKGAGRAQKAKKDFAQVLRDRLQENIEKTTQTIKSGKLTGNDLAATYCLRATSQSHLGAFSVAIADANEAVKLSTDTLGCRAHVYFNAGEFDKSVGDYSQAIALGATEPRSFHLRGISKFYAGKFEEAADDLFKATSTDDREAQVYSDLWLAWTLRRLGKPLPEQLLTRTKNQAHGDWPRPALAVITGDITPREMMELIERKNADDRTMALAEGYFYLGQYYLARGDKAKARDSFQRARSQNVVMYMEHSASGFELERLGHDGPASTSSISSGAVATTENAPEKPTGQGAPTANRKTTHRPAAKGPDDWRAGLWRQ